MQGHILHVGQSRRFSGIFLLPVFLFFLLLSPKTGVAWGSRGHGIIAEIAFRYLDEQTKKNVLALLDGMTIEDAANWMDVMQNDPAYDFMKPYHYIDVPKGQDVTETTGDNVVGILTRTFHELETPSQLNRDKIKTDLLYLFHLIGDLHQPLHVGYPGDKGGNTYQVSFFGQGTNLHRLWDSDMIEYEKLTFTAVLATKNPNPSQIASIQKIDILRWANQSRSYLDQVYSIHGHTIDDRYLHQAIPVIENQLLDAGLRLAAVLQRYFKNIAMTNVSAKQTEAIAVIDIRQAASYEGKMVTICGKIFQAKYLPNTNRQPTFLDMGGYYPNAPLTLVIFGESRGSFADPPEIYFADKQVCVTGKVQIYRGKPEIIVDNQKQIKVK